MFTLYGGLYEECKYFLFLFLEITFNLFYYINLLFLGSVLLRIIFYFILLVLYFWEESYWDCASGVPFHL